MTGPQRGGAPVDVPRGSSWTLCSSNHEHTTSSNDSVHRSTRHHVTRGGLGGPRATLMRAVNSTRARRAPLVAQRRTQAVQPAQVSRSKTLHASVRRLVKLKSLAAGTASRAPGGFGRDRPVPASSVFSPSTSLSAACSVAAGCRQARWAPGESLSLRYRGGPGRVNDHSWRRRPAAQAGALRSCRTGGSATHGEHADKD